MNEIREIDARLIELRRIESESVPSITAPLEMWERGLDRRNEARQEMVELGKRRNELVREAWATPIFGPGQLRGLVD